MAGEVTTSRSALIQWLAKRIEKDHFPRVALSALLGISALVGFLTSGILLLHGWHAIAPRYFLGTMAGCVSFLGLIRVWAEFYHGAQTSKAYLRNLESEVGAEVKQVARPEAASVVSADNVADVALLGCEEGCLAFPIFLLVAAVSAIVAGVVATVSAAPTLAAEVIVDGLIAGEAYRRLRAVSNQHWLHGILGKTWKPMVLLVIIMTVVGGLMQHFFPGADSIGDIFVSRP